MEQFRNQKNLLKIFHVTFFNSDRFFIILMVKILIFSCKKFAYLEIQLWDLLKFWLSPGLMKKKKIICPRLDWNQGPHDSQAAIHTPGPEKAVINRYNFIKIYIARLMKKDRRSIWRQLAQFRDTRTFYNWILKFRPKQ